MFNVKIQLVKDFFLSGKKALLLKVVKSMVRRCGNLEIFQESKVMTAQTGLFANGTVTV